MKIKRRIEIETRTEKFLFAGTVTRTCVDCGGGAQMLTIDQAARFAGVDGQTIRRMIESGELHFHLTEADSGLVCLRSLADRTK